MASYEKITNILDYAVSLSPSAAFPIDARSMFGSYTAAAAAAATAENAGSTNTVYYIGQRLTVFENDVVATYLIQPDKTLKAIGAEVIGDEKTVTIGSNGEIGLKSFGVEYYAYHATDNILTGDYTYPDNMPAEAAVNDFVKVGDVWYKYTDGAWAAAENNPVETAYYELTTGWIEGLEPKVIKNSSNTGFELAWYEPSSTTVEGLNSVVGSVQTSVENLSTVVNANKEASDAALAEEVARAKAAEGALDTRVAKNENDITTLNGDADLEGSVKNQIAAAIAGIMENPDETMNSIQELVDWTTEHAEDALQLQKDVVANTTAIKALETLVGTLPEGTSATTVIGYIVEAVEAEKTRAMAAEGALATRVTAVEEKTANLGTAANKNADEFATAAQGAKADTAVQTVVKGEANGHIAVDGADVEVYTAPIASVTQAGDVKVDGSSISASEEGIISVSAVDASKVTGLGAMLTDTQDNAVSQANTYTDDNAVAKTNIAGTSNVAENVEAASDAKVASEKLLLDMMSWKTFM